MNIILKVIPIKNILLETEKEREKIRDSGSYGVEGTDFYFEMEEVQEMKSGATAKEAGAETNELWKTLKHATLPDGVVMQA